MWMIWQIESKVKVQTESNQLLASPEMVDTNISLIFFSSGEEKSESN